MKRYPHRFYVPLVVSERVKPNLALVAFSSVIFLFLLGDAIMSYFVPVYLNRHLNNPFITGIILSTSSVIGLISDLILGEWFKHKPLSQYLFWGGTRGIAYPLSFLFLPPVVPAFILSMSVWGIYFELILFARYHFINHFLPHHHHVLGWAVMGGFSDLAYLTGPVLSGLLLEQSPQFSLIFRSKLHSHALPVTHKPDLTEELQIWKLIIPKIWPVLLFVLVMTIFDSAMWSVGAILSSSFQDKLPIREALFVAYLAPTFIFGGFANHFTRLFGKKKTAFLAGATSGLIYLISGFITSHLTFILFVFLGSSFNALAWPAVRGTIEDYIERLGQSANLMVSLENSTTSLAYILGSISAGFIALKVGEQATFSVLGGVLFLISILGFVKLRHKVHLPQKEILALER